MSFEYDRCPKVFLFFLLYHTNLEMVNKAIHKYNTE